RVPSAAGIGSAPSSTTGPAVTVAAGSSVRRRTGETLRNLGGRGRHLACNRVRRRGARRRAGDTAGTCRTEPVAHKPPTIQLPLRKGHGTCPPPPSGRRRQHGPIRRFHVLAARPRPGDTEMRFTLTRPRG